METVSKNTIKGFSDYLFWDVDRSQLDLERSKVYIIDRVLSHGMLTDWFLLKEIYGVENIREVTLNLRYMDKYALAFCSAYFDEPIQRFRCYNFTQTSSLPPQLM
jgi:hypothetical protein